MIDFQKICYRLQCKWLEGNSRTNCWVRNLRDLLLANRFGYAWYNQMVGKELAFLRRSEQKGKFIHISLWFMEVTNMNRLRSNRILKDIFCFEDYFNDNMCASYKQLFVKFRGGLLDLKANTDIVKLYITMIARYSIQINSDIFRNLGMAHLLPFL